MNTQASKARELLSPEVLAGLANLKLAARAAVEGTLLGLHRSRRFGFSQEFAEYRAYAEGDDPRFIDWNVYARTDRVVVKRFLGETNSHLMLLLDASASMAFGSTGLSKLAYAQLLAASLAYLASHQHDAVGVAVFDESVRALRALHAHRSARRRAASHRGGARRASHGLHGAARAVSRRLSAPWHGGTAVGLLRRAAGADRARAGARLAGQRRHAAADPRSRGALAVIERGHAARGHGERRARGGVGAVRARDLSAAGAIAHRGAGARGRRGRYGTPAARYLRAAAAGAARVPAVSRASPMTLLAPLFLAGLAAIALPLWLHLRREPRRSARPFSSAMLLRGAPQPLRVRRRWRERLLLALRVLLLAALCL